MAAGSDAMATTCQSAVTAFGARGTSPAMEPTGSESSATVTISAAPRRVNLCGACMHRILFLPRRAVLLQ